jgi:folylpolyglutamate synthase/dihydropteroate synthase
MSAQELSEIAKKYTKTVYAFDDIKRAVDLSIESANENTAVFVVGSLYLAGEIRDYLIEFLNKFN